MNAIEKNETIETTEMNKRDLIKKAVVTFREGYKENKHVCTLEVFMLYAIIKGKHVDVTIKDNHYKEGCNPFDHHPVFKYNIEKVSNINAGILVEYGQGAIRIISKSNYMVNSVNEKVKYFFGLTPVEFEFLLNQYVEERKAS
jgi:hypothetical protein